MIIKGAINDELVFRLEGGYAQRGHKFTDRALLNQVMDAERDSLVKQSMWAYDQQFNTIDQNYIFEYKNVAVVLDTDTDLYKCTLPVNVLSLPQDKGVHQVSLMKGQQMAFVRIEQMYQSMLSRADYLGQIPFYVVGSEIIIPKQLINSDIGFDKGLLLYLVKAGVDVSDTEKYIMGDLQKALTDTVFARMMPTENKFEDKSNNLV